MSPYTLVDKYEPKIKAALMAAFDQVRDKVKLRELASIISEQGIHGAYNYLNQLNIAGILDAGVLPVIEDAFTESGRMTLDMMPKDGIIGETFRFDVTSPVITSKLSQQGLALIRSIDQATREAIQRGLQANITAGMHPTAAARDFRANIGLTPKQEQAVRNFRMLLETGDKAALDRALRDKRFDPSVVRALSGEKPIDKKKVDKMVQRYRERYLKYRSETIARTEAMRAVNSGRHAASLQMVDEGFIDRQRVRKFWINTRDTRTRANHVSIPGMNPDGVPVDQPFNTPLGPMMFPHDPNGSAENVINCRCTFTYKVID